MPAIRGWKLQYICQLRFQVGITFVIEYIRDTIDIAVHERKWRAVDGTCIGQRIIILSVGIVRDIKIRDPIGIILTHAITASCIAFYIRILHTHDSTEVPLSSLLWCPNITSSDVFLVAPVSIYQSSRKIIRTVKGTDSLTILDFSTQSDAPPIDIVFPEVKCRWCTMSIGMCNIALIYIIFW